MTGGAPARRAVVRWAVRMFRREWRQQLVVIVLLTVAVTAALAGSAVAVEGTSTSNGDFGSAHGLIRLDTGDPAAAASRIEGAKQRFGTVDVIAHETVPIPASIHTLDVRDQDPHGPYSAPMLAVRSGRYPTAPGEVALTSSAAALLDVGTSVVVGSRVTLGGITAAVVGFVENPSKLSDTFALVAPGTLTAPTSYVLLVEPDSRSSATQSASTAQPGFALEVRGDGSQAVATLVLLVVALAMALVGLIAAAGFAVVAHRRQRQLGLLAAMGADDRHVRLVMLANGALVGVVTAVLGSAAALGIWLLAAPAVETTADHRISRSDLPWTLLAGVVCLELLAATLAAWWPARSASRLPVMAALSGRPERPQPIHRSLLVALVLVGGGVAAITYARPLHEHPQPLLLIAGLLSSVIGMVFVAPAAVHVLGRLARWLPLAPRLALRDLARYQARAAAALAAITLGLSVAVAVVVVTSAEEIRPGDGNLSSRELLVRVGDLRSGPNPDLTAAEVAALDARAATVIAALGSGVRSVPVDVAFSPTTPGRVGPRQPVEVGLQTGPHSIEFAGQPYVATPELLAMYRVDANSFDASSIDLLTSTSHRSGFVVFASADARPDLNTPGTTPTAQVALPTYRSAPSVLVTEAAMQRRGWTSARAGWMVESSRPLSASQLRAARAAAASVGLLVESRDTSDTISSLRTGATFLGVLLALAIAAMTVGLIRTESARDLQTLTATGASPRVRRALTASTAAALTVPGVVLGTVGAYITLVAVYHSVLHRLTPVPVVQLVVLIVGTPAAAAVVGLLLSGREPASFSRRSLD